MPCENVLCAEQYSIMFAKVLHRLQKNLSKPLTKALFDDRITLADKTADKLYIAEWSSWLARRAHNPKVVGSNPSSATKEKPDKQ